jgi:hypothetical protein
LLSLQPQFVGASSVETIKALQLPFLSDELQEVFKLVDARILEAESAMLQKIEFTNQFADISDGIIKKPNLPDEDAWMLK